MAMSLSANLGITKVQFILTAPHRLGNPHMCGEAVKLRTQVSVNQFISSELKLT